MEHKMRRILIATAVFASLAFTAQANDGLDVSAKKVVASTAVPASKQVEAPFTAAHDPLPMLLVMEEQERRGLRSTCDAAATTLCFDAADGRIVYRGARNFMPQISGLRAESMGLRGNRVSFRYSFK
jgi:hypothetical protein